MTAAPARAAATGREDDMLPGETRTSQLLMAAVLLVGAGVVTIGGSVTDTTPLALSLVATLAATAIALTAPWRRLPRWAPVVVLLIDALAVGLLHRSSPESGLEQLWAFPAIWATWAFGLRGAVGAVIATCGAYWTLGMLDGDVHPERAVVFPAAIAVLVGVLTVIRRRSRAQRDLLQRQSVALRGATSRAQRQEALVTDVLDAVDFGVVGFDETGRTTISNEAHHRLDRVRDAAGSSVFAADGFTPLRPEDHPEARALRGETFDNALLWYGEPGSPDRTAVQATARADVGASSPGGRIVITADVTDELLALRSREDLVDSVSHELRTPLTSILGHLELAVDDEDLSASTRHSLTVAERNAERLLALVTDVLAASATSRMGLDLRIDPVAADLAEPLRAAAEAARVPAAAREVTIDVTGVEPALAVIDVHRIRQVADNLIGNAIKYGREGGRIEVGCTADADHAWMVVRDDGPGIAAVDLPRVFDRFFRSAALHKTSTHGSGLGLAISRDVVRAHGGEITVSSEPGQGATFVVRLPLAPQEGTA